MLVRKVYKIGFLGSVPDPLVGLGKRTLIFEGVRDNSSTLVSCQAPKIQNFEQV